MRSKVLCVTTELSRHVGTTTLAQIQCHGVPLVRKTEKSNFILFLLLHPITRGSSLESSVARRLKSSFISSSFFAFLLSRPSILPAPPGLSPPHFFLDISSSFSTSLLSRPSILPAPPALFFRFTSFSSVHYFACCCSDEDDDWL